MELWEECRVSYSIRCFILKHFTGLWYDEDVSISTADEWSEQFDADEAIVLLSNFKVDSSGGDGSLNPNETYTNWQWVLVRESNRWISAGSMENVGVRNGNADIICLAA